MTVFERERKKSAYTVAPSFSHVCLFIIFLLSFFVNNLLPPTHILHTKYVHCATLNTCTNVTF